MTTTNVQHTPGPWLIWHTPLATLIQTDKGLNIAKMGGDSLEADECLIAAAPDLLAALEQLVRDYDADNSRPPFIATAREVIAKARGEA